MFDLRFSADPTHVELPEMMDNKFSTLIVFSPGGPLRNLEDVIHLGIVSRFFSPMAH